MGGSLQFHYFSLGPVISLGTSFNRFPKVHRENFTPMIKPLKYLILNAVKIRTGVFRMKKSFTMSWHSTSNYQAHRQGDFMTQLKTQT